MTFDVPPMRLSGDLEPSRRCCQWCGKLADPHLHDIDGAWCSPEHRQFDRASESTIRRRWGQ